MTRTTKAWVAVAAVVTVAAAGGLAVALSSDATPAAQSSPVDTAPVQRGRLSDTVSLDGTLTYQGRPDGAPLVVVNRARGTYTQLPAPGAEVDCGAVLYRVNDRPVLLLCGRLPAYRDLRIGDTGRDVRQLNRSLHRLGYRTDPRDTRFGGRTQAALRALQRARGLAPTGVLALGEAVVLPERVRIAKVTGELAEPARPGAPVAQATSDTLGVQVQLDAAQQGDVHRGQRARITLPGLRTVPGRVARLGTVAQAPAGENTGAATIPAFIRLDRPARPRGLDRAPVQVEIATAGVRDALNVPVTALVGKAGGGFAVEVVRATGQRDFVPVRLGLFDATAGRVQVEGAVRAGDRVVVPSV